MSEPINRAEILGYEREPKLPHRAIDLVESHFSANTIMCGSPDGASDKSRGYQVDLVRGIAPWYIDVLVLLVSRSKASARLLEFHIRLHKQEQPYNNLHTNFFPNTNRG